MKPSQRGTTIIIAVLSAAVIALVIALVVVTRPGETPPAGQPPQAAAPADRGQGGFAPALSGATPAKPPARAKNELGQPLGQDGRPIGPAEKLAAIRNKPVAAGEVPLTPPLFTDATRRAAFKQWWVTEMRRRIAIYQDLEPSPEYPSAEAAARLLDELYDAAEPRRPGESVQDAYGRRRTWQTLWKQFLDSYGATVHTVMSRAGDPQYGTTPPPPVQPPGVPDDSAPPATPAESAPPGRGPGARGGPGGANRTAPANEESR
jgi:hypothetical protein